MWSIESIVSLVPGAQVACDDEKKKTAHFELYSRVLQELAVRPPIRGFQPAIDTMLT